MQMVLSWQGFQFVVRIMRWEEMEQNDSDEELGKIEDDIRQIRELLE